MKNTRAFIATAFLSALLVSAISGCAEKKGELPTPPADAKPAPVSKVPPPNAPPPGQPGGPPLTK